MNRAFLWPAVLLAVVSLAASTPAQPPPSSAGGPNVAPIAVQLVLAAPAPAADMQEDVEIMRRLLDGAFAEVYGVSAHHPLTPGIRYYPLIGPALLSAGGRNVSVESVNPIALHTEGVYLKDYGVVYTVTLPPTGFDVLPASQPSAGGNNPPDKWDLIKKEIHGETPTPEPQAAPAHKPLSEVILKTLADNGKHFGALADNERISVVVTFRGAANCANCHQNGWDPNKLGEPVFLNAYSQDGPSLHYHDTPDTSNPGTAGSTPSAQTAGTTTPAWLTDARNAIMLGDLHLKQGKTKEAIDAYGKEANTLIQAIENKKISEPGLNQRDVPVLLTLVDLCNRLAAARVQIGDDTAAKTTLARSAEFAALAEKLTAGAAGTAVTQQTEAATAGQALPAKLIVTASKKQLDDVGSGKLTFEAFCKAATVESVGPSKK
jgi:hypothetical protein